MLKAILAIALSLPPTKYDRDADPDVKSMQLSEVAAAVAAETSDPRVAAFVLAWGWHESKFSIAIGECRCERWQCDARRLPDGKVEFRARGLWQSHRRGAPEWDQMCGPGGIRVQARQAVRHASWSLAKCDGDIRCAFRRLGGLRIDVPLRGEADRVASFERIRKGL
jgi:hypothetical protein